MPTTAYADAAIKIGSDALLGSAALDSIKASDGTAMPELIEARLIRSSDGTTAYKAKVYLPSTDITDKTDTTLDRYKHFLRGSVVEAKANIFYKTSDPGVTSVTVDAWFKVALA